MEALFPLLYLVAAVCFIMALRGLSSPETARSGNIYGITGMVIAILTTLALSQVVSYWMIGVGILIGTSLSSREVEPRGDLGTLPPVDEASPTGNSTTPASTPLCHFTSATTNPLNAGESIKMLAGR